MSRGLLYVTKKRYVREKAVRSLLVRARPRATSKDVLEGVSLLRLETLPLRPLPPDLELTLSLFLDPISSSFFGGIFSLPCPGRLGPREK